MILKNTCSNLNFAVIGAGNGGRALAAYLGIMGLKVNLYNRSPEPLQGIISNGYIDLTGSINGRGILNLVTCNLEKAIKNVDIIMVATPASAHKAIANKISSFITNDQIIVLNPGRTGGALEFRNIIKSNNPFKDICIVEAQTLLFACRTVSSNLVKIFSKKKEVKVAALPAIRTNEFLRLVEDIFPEFTASNSVLETSFNNVGAILHPIPTLLNSARIESIGDFEYYIDGITESVAKVILNADNERMCIAERLGIRAISLMEWLKYTYGATGNTLCEALYSINGYHGINAPNTISTRYIYEDVPQSLVPIADMGRHLGISTPTIDSVIHMTSLIFNTDYFKYGRKISDMGLDKLSSVSNIKNYVKYGTIEIADDEEGVVA